MYKLNLSHSIRVSHLEFIQSNSQEDQDDRVGKVSFFLNNFIQFRNIPIRQRPTGKIIVDLTSTGKAIGSGFLREEVCREIQRQVTEQLTEMVP